MGCRLGPSVRFQRGFGCFRTLAVVAAMVFTGPALAGGGGLAVRGEALVSAHCAGCHAIGRAGASPRAEAPPLRTLHLRYPVDHLAEALAEGIVTGHPEMPQFAFEPEEVDAIIVYLQSLEGSG